MKTQKLGRHELLNWLNEFTQCDYPRIEVCCDGIGYCQVIDAIHPGVINMAKINFNAKYPDDYSRNLKILDDAFTKLNFEKVVPIDKLNKGKFQDNMLFLQWLYNYSSKIGPFAIKTYKGYEKRVEALQKQKNKASNMSAHLIPNTAFLKLRADQRMTEGFEEAEEQAIAQERGYDYFKTP
jgi:RP/EB family microtubule-associated protein